jgi:hypothetical protein
MLRSWLSLARTRQRRCEVSQDSPQSDRSTEIQALGSAWLGETEKLRAVEVPDVSAPPPEVHKALVEARGNLDRLEEILSLAMVLRSGAEARAKDLTEKADDDFDTALVARSKRAREFEAGRERQAQASLDTLPQRHTARSAARLSATAADIEKRVRLRYYGLVKLRDELADRLKHTSWESNLDR